MEENKEGQEPQKNPETEVVVENKEKETLTPEQIADLKHRAEVSSQNFERLKKIEEENKKLRQELEVSTSDLDGDVKTELFEIKQKLAKSEVQAKYPELKDAWEDFEKYHQEEENNGMKLETAVKAFLVEKGLLGGEKRKGLEKSTGGNKTPTPSGVSSEDLSKLRKDSWAKYRDLAKKGGIKFR